MPAKRARTATRRDVRTFFNRKANPRRRGKPHNRMVSVPRSKMAFPQSMRTKLRYVERIDFVPTGTGAHQYQFRANDLYDPNKTGTGHKARGFDEFMEIYDTFTVLGSKISVSFMYEGYDGPSLTALAGNLIKTVGNADSQPALTPMVCGLHKGLETLGSGAAEEQMEKDRTNWTYINAQHGHKTLKQSLRVSDFFGKGTLVGAEGYTGTASSGPTEEVLYECWCARVSNDYPQEATKVVAYATIEFDAVFTEPKTLGAS